MSNCLSMLSRLCLWVCEAWKWVWPTQGWNWHYPISVSIRHTLIRQWCTFTHKCTVQIYISQLHVQCICTYVHACGHAQDRTVPPSPYLSSAMLKPCHYYTAYWYYSVSGSCSHTNRIHSEILQQSPCVFMHDCAIQQARTKKRFKQTVTFLSSPHKIEFIGFFGVMNLQ